MTDYPYMISNNKIAPIYYKNSTGGETTKIHIGIFAFYWFYKH